MTSIFLAITALFVLTGNAHAKTTLFQCAVDRVEGHGARVNVIENKGHIRANLIFGTTVSGTIYSVTKTNTGYAGQIKSKPGFTIELVITDKRDTNSNIDGYEAYLKATYPTLQNSDGYDLVETLLVCGKKISDRWN
jgi:hypothetical protein